MSPAESGKSVRRLAAAVPSITGLRLSPHGVEALLVNISETGLLAECTVRLKVGSATQVVFEGGFSPAAVAGRVARCEVSAMGRDGVLRYHIAVEFNSPLAFEDEDVAARQPQPDVPLEAIVPIHEPVPVPCVARNRW